MRKLTQAVAAIALTVGLMAIGNTVSAQTPPQQNCNILIINGTGPGSNNQVTCTTTVSVTVDCVNNIYVLDSQSQTAVSGAAIVGGNVTGGTAVSGNATNANGQTVAIGASCGQTPSTTTTTTSTPPAAETVVPAAAPKQKVAALPFTAGSSALELVTVSTIIVATVLASVRLAIVAYRRMVIK